MPYMCVYKFIPYLSYYLSYVSYLFLSQRRCPPLPPRQSLSPGAAPPAAPGQASLRGPLGRPQYVQGQLRFVAVLIYAMSRILSLN